MMRRPVMERSTAVGMLNEIFNVTDFRKQQWEVIEAALSGEVNILMI